MYKIDDEFRPRGRVFMKAKREHDHEYYPSSAMVSRSNSRSSGTHRRGPAITTNLDDSNLRFRHEIMNEKVIEATVTEHPAMIDTMNREHWKALPSSMSYGNELVAAPAGSSVVAEVTRNKRYTTEVLGNTMETTSTSQRATDGHRRMTTHIVRKITTLTRAEEQAHADNKIRQNRDVKTTEIGYLRMGSQDSKRAKVNKLSTNSDKECFIHTIITNIYIFSGPLPLFPLRPDASGEFSVHQILTRNSGNWIFSASLKIVFWPSLIRLKTTQQNARHMAVGLHNARPRRVYRSMFTTLCCCCCCYMTYPPGGEHKRFVVAGDSNVSNSLHASGLTILSLSRRWGNSCSICILLCLSECNIFHP